MQNSYELNPAFKKQLEQQMDGLKDRMINDFQQLPPELQNEYVAIIDYSKPEPMEHIKGKMKPSITMFRRWGIADAVAGLLRIKNYLNKTK